MSERLLCALAEFAKHTPLLTITKVAMHRTTSDAHAKGFCYYTIDIACWRQRAAKKDIIQDIIHLEDIPPRKTSEQHIIWQVRRFPYSLPTNVQTRRSIVTRQLRFLVTLLRVFILYNYKMAACVTVSSVITLLVTVTNKGMHSVRNMTTSDGRVSETLLRSVAKHYCISETLRDDVTPSRKIVLAWSGRHANSRKTI